MGRPPHWEASQGGPLLFERRTPRLFRSIAPVLVALAALTVSTRFVVAQGSSWQARFDAGWEAYQRAKYDEAARLLGAVEREARAFPADDPRLAAVSDRLA